MYSNWGYAYANCFVLVEVLNIFRLAAIVTGGKMNPSGNLSFTKRIYVGWTSEVN
jgi:hypothetical protein